MFHTIFQQPDAQSVWAQAREVVAFCQEKFPHVASYLEEALDELLAFTNAPKSVWKKVCSNNPTEQLNREIGRRTGNEPAPDTIKPLVLSKGRNTAQTDLPPCFLLKTPVSTF